MINMVKSIGCNVDVSNVALFGVKDAAEVGVEERGKSSSSNTADRYNSESHVWCIENVLE